MLKFICFFSLEVLIVISGIGSIKWVAEEFENTTLGIIAIAAATVLCASLTYGMFYPWASALFN